MIGYHLAANLGVTVGQEITLISPQGTATLAGWFPRIKAFKVAAIFDVGMYEYDSAYVFMPLEAAQLYFNLPQHRGGGGDPGAHGRRLSHHRLEGGERQLLRRHPGREQRHVPDPDADHR